jgi:hypothetical protein
MARQVFDDVYEYESAETVAATGLLAAHKDWPALLRN